MRQVIFDSDVLIDVLAQRQPFVTASAQALNRVTQPDVQGFVSAHAVTNIFYILRRQVGSETARELLLRLLLKCETIGNSYDGIHTGRLTLPWKLHNFTHCPFKGHLWSQ